MIYKNYSSYVEFTNGKNIEITGSNKKSSIEKTIIVKNQGADPILKTGGSPMKNIWNSIDLSGSINSFSYIVSGSSLTGKSYAGAKSAAVPTMTSEGILMGEKIEAGDAITYIMKVTPTMDSLDEDHLYASIMVNVRR